MSHWSRAENELIVSQYIEMIRLDLAGITFNKSERYRELSRQLPLRNENAVGRKHQNISAVMIDLGQLPVRGITPLWNYQELLHEVVAARIGREAELQDLVRAAVEAPNNRDSALTDDIFDLVTSPPKPSRGTESIYARTRERASVFGLTNWLEREARNRSLGLAGEKFAVAFEHRRLWLAGQPRLADRVEHASQVRGDGLGYDIHSFETDGAERLIEVKTTRLDAANPFFVSLNEVATSGEHAASYIVYRLYDFGSDPHMYQLRGDLRSTCRLDPVSYSASVA